MKEQLLSKAIFTQPFPILKEVANSMQCDIDIYNNELYIFRFQSAFEGDLNPIAQFGYLVRDYEKKSIN